MGGDLHSANARRWWTLSVLGLAQLMVLLDVTVINIALPGAQRALHFSASDRQWVITAYALAFGSLLLLGGRVSDLWGRRTALYVGLAGFALASAMGGFAHSFTVLIIARAIQGVFGALVAPASLAALSVTFSEPRERATAFAVYGVIAGAGPAIGIILGGALTQWASWRWCLFVNLFFAGLAIIGVSVFVRGETRGRRTKFDVMGAVLASVGLFFVVYGLSHARSSGWGNIVTWGAILIGVTLLAGFVLWQRRSTHPLMPLRIVTTRTRAGSLVSLLLTTLGIYAVFLLLVSYLEETLGFSPLRTGFAFLPLVLSISLSAGFASARLLARTGPRPLVPTGMVLAAMGMVLFTRLTPFSDYCGHVLPGLIVTGLGLGLIIAPATASATAHVEPLEVGAASALVNTTQQIGGSLGTVLLNTIAVTVTLRAVLHTLSRSSAAATAATLHGYSIAFWWAGGFFAFGSVVTFFVLESGAGVDDAELEPVA